MTVPIHHRSGKMTQAYESKEEECREPLQAQPPTEAKMGHLNQNLNGKKEDQKVGNSFK